MTSERQLELEERLLWAAGEIGDSYVGNVSEVFGHLRALERVVEEVRLPFNYYGIQKALAALDAVKGSGS